MKRVYLAVAVGAALGLTGAPFAAGQTSSTTAPPDVDQLVELLRKDVRAGKADIVAKTMELDATQSAAFWPVYKKYEAERQALGNERLAIIKDLAEHFDSLTDAKARGLIERSFGVEERRIALEKRYKDEFLKVLPPKVVARLLQVETRLNDLINLKLSSQIPLVN